MVTAGSMPTKIGNFFIKAIVNSPLHPLLGDSFAVITLTGHKSGKQISTPINVVLLDGMYTVVSLRQRTWWRNLRGDRPARLRHRGKTAQVHGKIVEKSEQVVTGLTAYFAKYPAYAKYFQIELDSKGRPDPEKLKAVAQQRVLIQLYPS